MRFTNADYVNRCSIDHRLAAQVPALGLQCISFPGTHMISRRCSPVKAVSIKLVPRSDARDSCLPSYRKTSVL